MRKIENSPKKSRQNFHRSRRRHCRLHPLSSSVLLLSCGSVLGFVSFDSSLSRSTSGRSTLRYIFPRNSYLIRKPYCYHYAPLERLGATNGETEAGPSSSTFFDMDENIVQGVHCVLPGDPHIDPDAFNMASNSERQFWIALDTFVQFIPILNPIVAFYSYENLAQTVDVFTNVLSESNWVPVDGGAYQAKIIAPAINGVIVPAISILFATLISNTVSILRQRLLDIRTTINLEASDLRYLQTMIDSFPAQGSDQRKCRSYLIQYISRVIAESQPGTKMNALEPTGMDSEMHGMLAQINRNVNNNNKNDRIADSIMDETYGAITRLNTHRAKRISALQSTFPPLHYAIVSALALSICVAFLMETNQELLIFLNSIQLRILWTMLIGTFSALGVVCYDLRDVFGGSNQVAKSVDQLFTIRSALIASASAASVTSESSR